MREGEERFPSRVFRKLRRINETFLSNEYEGGSEKHWMALPVNISEVHTISSPNSSCHTHTHTDLVSFTLLISHRFYRKLCVRTQLFGCKTPGISFEFSSTFGFFILMTKAVAPCSNFFQPNRVVWIEHAWLCKWKVDVLTIVLV